jgi:hypothetical protein
MTRAEFHPESLAACLVAIERAETPLTVAELRRQLQPTFAFRAAQEKHVEGLLEAEAKEARVHVWPPVPHGKRKRFWHVGFADTVAEKLMEALAGAPATPRQAVERLRGLLPRVGSKKASEEARRQLQRLATDDRVIEFAANRQTQVYFSNDWLRKLVGAPAVDALPEAILAAVEGLESRRGNYVAVDEVRASAPVRRAFDKTAVQLARKGYLVLGSYDGQRPIPEQHQAEFVEDSHGNLYIGVARAREGDEI